VYSVFTNNVSFFRQALPSVGTPEPAIRRPVRADGQRATDAAFLRPKASPEQTPNDHTPIPANALVVVLVPGTGVILHAGPGLGQGRRCLCYGPGTRLYLGDCTHLAACNTGLAASPAHYPLGLFTAVKWAGVA